MAIGDVYSVDVDGVLHYFQHVANDRTQLNSDVIRVFKKFNFNTQPSMEEIAACKADFYAHVILPIGVKRGVWVKVGKAKVRMPVDPIFRQSGNEGNYSRDASKNWFIWSLNKPMQKVSKISKELKKIDIGSVVRPNDVVERIRSGEYDFVYPTIAEI